MSCITVAKLLKYFILSLALWLPGAFPGLLHAADGNPAFSQVVYVPYYDPAGVYGPWAWPLYPPVLWAPWDGYGWSNGFAWRAPRSFDPLPGWQKVAAARGGEQATP